MDRDVQRVDGYSDPRFSRAALLQHGAFLIDGRPCEVEITGPETAVVRGDLEAFPALIEAFRFYAEHVARFFDPSGACVAAFAPVNCFDVALDRIQPSQFYVDRDKLAAVATFVKGPEDIVVPLTPHGDRYVSLDGHTRLALAAARGYGAVRGFLTGAGDWLEPFVAEAERRGVCAPKDLTLLSHEDYEQKWNRYCDAVFAGEAP